MELQTGKVTGKVRFIAPPQQDYSLYYGIAFGKTENGTTPVYVSRGGEDAISILTLGSEGTISDSGRKISYPEHLVPTSPSPRNPAGLAVSADGQYLYSVDNTGIPDADMGSQLHGF